MMKPEFIDEEIGTVAYEYVKFSSLHQLPNDQADAKAAELAAILKRTAENWICDEETRLEEERQIEAMRGELAAA